MLTVRARVYGLDSTETWLQGLSSRAANLQPIWPTIETIFWKWEREQFEGEGALSGGWPPLSQKYAEWKARHYPGRRILELRGYLKESMTGRGRYTVLDEAPQHLVIGTSVPYARKHQTGRGRVPARPFLVVPRREVQEFSVALAQYLVLGR